MCWNTNTKMLGDVAAGRGNDHLPLPEHCRPGHRGYHALSLSGWVGRRGGSILMHIQGVFLNWASPEYIYVKWIKLPTLSRFKVGLGETNLLWIYTFWCGIVEFVNCRTAESTVKEVQNTSFLNFKTFPQRKLFLVWWETPLWQSQ